MMRFYWCYLIGFILLCASLGMLNKFYVGKRPKDISCDLLKTAGPHPFLCGRKIPINQATVLDISQVDGISHKTAREIAQFIKECESPKIDDLLAVKGIGEKKLLRLKERFF